VELECGVGLCRVRVFDVRVKAYFILFFLTEGAVVFPATAEEEATSCTVQQLIGNVMMQCPIAICFDYRTYLQIIP
jgi:hypothetical protein